MTAHDVHESVQRIANTRKAVFLQRFFKTGKGQYGEGDVFVGLTVPQSRQIARLYRKLSKEECSALLLSSIHEERLIALLILVDQYSHASKPDRAEIVSFYLSQTKRINNWDLVDLSADKILGKWLVEHPDDALLQKLASSSLLWERRIAMISTFASIKRNDPRTALQTVDILLHDREDLMHKAVGWMLREVGKRCDERILKDFLQERYSTMPRTMLRYAIERFPEHERQRYLNGEV